MGHDRRGGGDEFAEDDYPHEPPKDEPEPVPEWDLAKLHVAQAAVAFKSGEKSTPILQNIVYNLEAALAALRKAL